MLKPDWHIQWDPDPGYITGIQNDKIYTILLSAASEETRANEMTRENEMNMESHTELDSHGNKPVVGKHAYIIAETGKKVDVSPFTPDDEPLTEIRSPSSDYTVCQGNWGTHLNHCRNVW